MFLSSVRRYVRNLSARRSACDVVDGGQRKGDVSAVPVGRPAPGGRREAAGVVLAGVLVGAALVPMAAQGQVFRLEPFGQLASPGLNGSLGAFEALRVNSRGDVFGHYTTETNQHRAVIWLAEPRNGREAGFVELGRWAPKPVNGTSAALTETEEDALGGVRETAVYYRLGDDFARFPLAGPAPADQTGVWNMGTDGSPSGWANSGARTATGLARVSPVRWPMVDGLPGPALALDLLPTRASAEALGGNRHGLTVGRASDAWVLDPDGGDDSSPAAWEARVGTLWIGSGVVDLNERTGNLGGWKILEAEGVNDSGVILAKARDPLGVERPVRLVPAGADVNADGTVDQEDLSLFITEYFGGGFAADFNIDGYVDAEDLTGFITSFVEGPPPPGTIEFPRGEFDDLVPSISTSASGLGFAVPGFEVSDIIEGECVLIVSSPPPPGEAAEVAIAFEYCINNLSPSQKWNLANPGRWNRTHNPKCYGCPGGAFGNPHSPNGAPGFPGNDPNNPDKPSGGPGGDGAPANAQNPAGNGGHGGHGVEPGGTGGDGGKGGAGSPEYPNGGGGGDGGRGGFSPEGDGGNGGNGGAGGRANFQGRPGAGGDGGVGGSTNAPGRVGGAGGDGGKGGDSSFGNDGARAGSGGPGGDSFGGMGGRGGTGGDGGEGGAFGERGGNGGRGGNSGYGAIGGQDGGRGGHGGRGPSTGGPGGTGGNGGAGGSTMPGLTPGAGGGPGQGGIPGGTPGNWGQPGQIV